VFARATTATIYAASARCAELQIDDARVAAATAVQNKCPPIAVVAGAIATAISTAVLLLRIVLLVITLLLSDVDDSCRK